MSKERLDYVDILKGLGILLVIFSHSGAEEWFMSHFGDFFVPLFFIASGYTFLRRDAPLLTSFIKRSKRLLQPYFFFSVILLILYKRFALIDLLGIFYSRYCLYPYYNVDNVFFMGGGNPPLWFLTSMLTAFIPFILFVKYPKCSLLIALSCLLYTYGCQFLPILLPWSIDTAGLTGLFMCVGFFLRKSSKLFKGGPGVDLMLLFLFGAFCFFNGSDNLSIREYGRSFILYFIVSVLAFLLFLRLSKCLESTIIRKTLVELGRNSLVVFCIQMFLLRICHQIFHGMMHMPTEGCFFYLITSIKVLLVAYVGLLVSKWMNKYLPWIFK